MSPWIRGSSGLHPLTHASSRWLLFPPSDFHEVRIEPNATGKPIIDGYAWMDVGSKIYWAVRCEDGEYRWLDPPSTSGTRCILEGEVAALPLAPPGLLPPQERISLLRLWLLVVLGIAAPVLMTWLSRAYKRQQR